YALHVARDGFGGHRRRRSGLLRCRSNHPLQRIHRRPTRGVSRRQSTTAQRTICLQHDPRRAEWLYRAHMERRLVSSNTPWEARAGYSRAVRVGNHVWVAGTTASDERGELHGGNSAYEQTRYILDKIERGLREAGASLADVVRTRVYITRME